MVLICPFSLSAASVGILRKTGQTYWGLGLVTRGKVALDLGSKDWEGRSQRQSTAGPGTPGVELAKAPGACDLGLTMAGSAGWWRGEIPHSRTWGLDFNFWFLGWTCLKIIPLSGYPWMLRQN